MNTAHSNIKTLIALLLAGVFAAGAAWADSNDRFDISINDDPESVKLQGLLKMSCWLKKGDRQAKWTYDVPIYASSKHWMHRCAGFVTIALDPDGPKTDDEWVRIKKLKRCTEGVQPERNAILSYDNRNHHAPYRIRVFDYCERRDGIF